MLICSLCLVMCLVVDGLGTSPSQQYFRSSRMPGLSLANRAAAQIHIQPQPQRSHASTSSSQLQASAASSEPDTMTPTTASSWDSDSSKTPMSTIEMRANVDLKGLDKVSKLIKPMPKIYESDTVETAIRMMVESKKGSSVVRKSGVRWSLSDFNLYLAAFQISPLNI